MKNKFETISTKEQKPLRFMRQFGIHQSGAISLRRPSKATNQNSQCSLAAATANQNRRFGSFKKNVRPETNLRY